jgi:hypothetical protein
MEKNTRRVGSRTNGLRRRHLHCFLHRFHKRSRVRAPAKSLLRFRRRDVVPNRRRNVYLRHSSTAFASFRAAIPTSPLCASRNENPGCLSSSNPTFLRLGRLPSAQMIGEQFCLGIQLSRVVYIRVKVRSRRACRFSGSA